MKDPSELPKYRHPFLREPLTLCAHRGNSAMFPENTIPAFESAAELNVDCMETDIHLSRDGHCIVSHDADLMRTCGVSGSIPEYDLYELKSFDAGFTFSLDNDAGFPFRAKGIRLPTLSELLEHFPDMRFNVDLKSASPRLAESFVEVIRRKNAGERVLAASFHSPALKLLRRLEPTIATSYAKSEAARLLLRYLIGGLPSTSGLAPFDRFFTSLSPLDGESFQIPEYYGKLRVVTPSLVRSLHYAGIAVQVWTINSTDKMLQLLDMGVDGVMSDTPAELSAALGR